MLFAGHVNCVVIKAPDRRRDPFPDVAKNSIAIPVVPEQMERLRVDAQSFFVSRDAAVPGPDLFFGNEAILTCSECKAGDLDAAGDLVARFNEVSEFTQESKCEGFDEVRFRANGVLISFVAGERQQLCFSVHENGRRAAQSRSEGPKGANDLGDGFWDGAFERNDGHRKDHPGKPGVWIPRGKTRGEKGSHAFAHEKNWLVRVALSDGREKRGDIGFLRFDVEANPAAGDDRVVPLSTEIGGDDGYFWHSVSKRSKLFGSSAHSVEAREDSARIGASPTDGLAELAVRLGPVEWHCFFVVGQVAGGDAFHSYCFARFGCVIFCRST